MNILLIGNGFDLAHKLPTTYKDFLGFCEKARRIYTFDDQATLDEYIEINLLEWEMQEPIKEILRTAFAKRKCNRNYNENGTYDLKVETSNTALDEMYTHIKDNIWLNYFLNCYKKMGQNWIDFESEISRVIQALEDARYQLECGGSLAGVEQNKVKILLAVLKASETTMKKAYGSLNEIDHFTGYLNKELERLIRALEIYIAEFVGKIDVLYKNPDIESLTLDHVLSFNYSNTYKRVYGNEKKMEYNYIHGEADINKSVLTSNLVLGIDEYLDDDRKDKELEFLTFKKFYQRIYKSTENDYLKWLAEIREDKSYRIHNLYIFGHSLDVTDKDILKMFICNDNVQTKIFYYRENEDDKRALGKLVKNLILMMGQDELIKRTGGVNKTIEFIPQTIE